MPLPGLGRQLVMGQMKRSPSAFALDPEGRILFAAGTVSDRLTSYRIDSETGALTPMANAVVGQRSAVVPATR